MNAKKISELTAEEWLKELKETSKSYKIIDDNALKLCKKIKTNNDKQGDEDLTNLVIAAHVKIALAVRIIGFYAHALQTSHFETLKLIKDLDSVLKTKNIEQAMKMIEEIRMELAKRSEKEEVVDFVAEGLDVLLKARGTSLQELMKEKQAPTKLNNPKRTPSDGTLPRFW